MIYEFIIAFLLYFTVLIGAYYATEEMRMPEWLQFPPFHCRKCLTFWSLIISSIVLGLSFELYVMMATVIILASLTAISMHIDQKNKTVRIEYDDFEPHDIPTSDDEPMEIEIKNDEIIINKKIDK